jgi:4'-phosphopantetheinyl transferase
MLQTTLSAEELSRASEFKFAKDRNHYIGAHGVLRHVLAGYAKCTAASLCFARGPQGKPELATNDRNVRFNLSHSHGLAVIAVSYSREVGVDVELFRPEFAGQNVAERHFSPSEIRELQNLPEELKTEGFFCCWTRKEAYVKARGPGLQIPLASFDVSLTPNAIVSLRSEDESRWSIRSFKPNPTYVGAIVAEGKGWFPRYYEWERVPFAE